MRVVPSIYEIDFFPNRMILWSVDGSENFVLNASFYYFVRTSIVHFSNGITSSQFGAKISLLYCEVSRIYLQTPSLEVDGHVTR